MDKVELNTDSEAAKHAKKLIYEIDNLSIEMLAPDFTMTSLEGSAIRLSDLRGEIVLLDFWATTCSPCIPEIPHLVEAHKKYSADFEIIGISLDWDREALMTMVEEKDG